MTAPDTEAEHLRALEIDTLSTLGNTAVAAVRESGIVVDGWTETDLDKLGNLTAQRTAGQVAVRQHYPALFTDSQIPRGYHPPAVGDGDLPADALSTTEQYHHGSMPMLITVQHGGSQTAFDGHVLPHDRPDMPVEQGITELAAAVRADVAASSWWTLPALTDTVHPGHATAQTQGYFEAQTYMHLAALRTEHPKQTSMLHLDLHGFTGGDPATDEYDIILGTAHRRTVWASNVDRKFAAFMGSLGHNVYLPEAQPGPNEHFTAEYVGSLVQRAHSMRIRSIVSIQVALRQEEDNPAASVAEFTTSLSAFCTSWYRDETLGRHPG